MKLSNLVELNIGSRRIALQLQQLARFHEKRHSSKLGTETGRCSHEQELMESGYPFVLLRLAQDVSTPTADSRMLSATASFCSK